MKTTKKIIFNDMYLNLFYVVPWSIDDMYRYAAELAKMQKEGELTINAYLNYLSSIIPGFKEPPVLQAWRRHGTLDIIIRRPVAVTAQGRSYNNGFDLVSYAFYR